MPNHRTDFRQMPDQKRAKLPSAKKEKENFCHYIFESE